MAVERVWESVHAECGHRTAREVHVPEWDRWRWRCTGCPARGVAWAPPAATCSTCGSARDAQREEALLDLDVRSAQHPRLLLDVTVRHAVPGDAPRATAASSRGGAVAKEAEATKKARYPDGRTPWRCVLLVLETCGRHGQQALQHFRALAKGLAEQEVP